MRVPRDFYSSICVYYSWPFCKMKKLPLDLRMTRSIFSRNSMESHLPAQHRSAAHSAKIWRHRYANLLPPLYAPSHADRWFSSVKGIHLQILLSSFVQFCPMFEYWTVLLTLFRSSFSVIMFTELL